MCNGGQLLNIQLKAAIAVDADRSPSAACHADADAGGNAKSHRAQAGRVIHTLPFANRKGKEKHLDSAAGAAAYDADPWPGFGGDDLREIDKC